MRKPVYVHNAIVIIIQRMKKFGLNVGHATSGINYRVLK